MRQVISFEQFYESIWLKIPEVWRNADSENGRPLQILSLTLAQHFYYSFYLKIASMEELFDPDTCPEKYLPFLAGVLNWKLLGTDAKSWRNQIRHAPLLYKIKGTRRALTIAEKLIGYSVYMTELYRDYTGQILPKEKLFNNFPLRVKTKPWFRKSTPDISDNIFNETFSDQLPSFNFQFGDISNLGSLLIPRTLRKSGSRSISLSSLPTYDPKTGSGSLARLCKVPRINVVLKKMSELDYVDSNGNSIDANLNEAVDLFLQFKPFHIYIQDLVVMYSLSDYIFGSLINKDGGTGEVSGDTILSRESAEIYVSVQEDDKISYYNQEQLGSCDADILDSSENLRFKGLLDTKYINIPTNYEIENNCNYLSSLGFSLSGYAKNIQTGNGSLLWSTADFSSMSGPVIPGTSSGSNILIDTQTGTIAYTSVIPEPNFKFASISLDLPYASSFSQLFSSIITEDVSNWFSGISTVTTQSFKTYKDTVVINSVPYNNLSTPSTPWSLKGLTTLLGTISDPINYKLYNTITKINSDNFISTTTDALRLLFKQPILILFKSQAGAELFLKHKIHFIYDTKNKKLVLNHKTIYGDMQNLPGAPSIDNLLVDGVLHIVYSALVPTSLDFSVVSSSRSLQLSNNREQTQFNRVTYIDNTGIQTGIDVAHYSPVYDFDDATGTLIEDITRTKVFKEALPAIFTRNSLHYEDTGSSYPAISYDAFSGRDTSKWLVYSEPADQLYNGAERLSKTIWASYFNVPFSGNALKAYDGIDTSPDSQANNRNSFRWQATVNNISETHPQYFASSRSETTRRNLLWTRGSASKMALPYVGSSRANVQGFRTMALFNRTENLSDYNVSLLANYGTDKYKYEIDTIDYTDMYRNPSIPFDPLPVPNTEVRDDSKTTITNGKTVYPSYTTSYNAQYEAPFDFSDRRTYYSDFTLKPSLYANNIRTDICPYNGDLFDDSADPVEFNIDGLEQFTDYFSIDSINDTELLLSRTNLFVSWREVNTGISMGTGLFPLVNYSRVRPNIKLVKNGIELAYGDYWTIASNPNRIFLTSNCAVSIGDVIEITYFTIDGIELPIVPADPITGIPYTGVNTQVYTQTILLHAAPSREVLYEIPLTHNAIIAWYRYDTNQYVSVSVDTGFLILEPTSTVYRDLVQPTLQVRKNGTILPYRLAWNIKALPNAVSYVIVLDQHISQTLQASDILTVSYTGLI